MARLWYCLVHFSAATIQGLCLFQSELLLLYSWSSLISRLSPFQNTNIEVVQAYTFSCSRVGEPWNEAKHGVSCMSCDEDPLIPLVYRPRQIFCAFFVYPFAQDISLECTHSLAQFKYTCRDSAMLLLSQQMVSVFICQSLLLHSTASFVLLA